MPALEPKGMPKIVSVPCLLFILMGCWKSTKWSNGSISTSSCGTIKDANEILAVCVCHSSVLNAPKLSLQCKVLEEYGYFPRSKLSLVFFMFINNNVLTQQQRIGGIRRF